MSPVVLLRACALGLILFGCTEKRSPKPQSDAPVAAAPRSNQKELPNIFIVVLDTLRYSETSLADPGLNTTPNLARIAKDAISFSNAYSTHDMTPPSHFAIFSGFKRGMHTTELDTKDHALATQLGRIGYFSLGVSGNHNFRPQTMLSAQCFTEFVVMADYVEALAEKEPKKAARLENRATDMIGRFSAEDNWFNRTMIKVDAEQVSSALESKLNGIAQPALVFLNYIDVHDPYFPDESWYDYGEEAPLDGFASDLRNRDLPEWMIDPERIQDPKKREDFQQRLRNVHGTVWNLSDDLNDAIIERYRARYRGELRELDARVGKLMLLLERRGLLRNSLVFITSDHGESFGEMGYITHSMRNKGDIEATRHVPLIMLPTFAKIGGPIQIEAKVSIADIAPTIYELVGIDDSKIRERCVNCYGQSLLRHLASKIEARPKLSRAESGGNEDNTARRKALLESLEALGYIQ